MLRHTYFFSMAKEPVFICICAKAFVKEPAMIVTMNNRDNNWIYQTYNDNSDAYINRKHRSQKTRTQKQRDQHVDEKKCKSNNVLNFK